MANLSKQKRDRMLKFLEELRLTHNDDASIRLFSEIENHLREKKYGLVWEEHSEEVDEMLQTHIPVFAEDKERRICKDENLPWNFIIEGDNLQALYLLEKTHRGKVDCIYIDPPYNTGAKDWKYNNDYVDGNDAYRHSKWLSMMKSRLGLAKQLLNPDNSVLICTIDEKEYLRLGCLLEEMFPSARIQMVATCINPAGASRQSEFCRMSEYIFFVKIGDAAPALIQLDESWLKSKKSKKQTANWDSIIRSGPSSNRTDRPNMFYPIFLSKDNKKIVGVGESLPISQSRDSVVIPCDVNAIWPLRSDGTEGRWRIGRETLMKLYENHFVKIGGVTKTGVALYYLKEGEQKKVLDGTYETIGFNEDGSYNIVGINDKKTFIPGDLWTIPSHNASSYGSVLLKKIIGDRFSFPKSLYAVHDTIRFFVANKPNAIVLDFFAGSGTTLHAVNLLNAEDGGNRKCISVTNNEVSLEEAKELTKKGYKKGDPEWEALGIAKYVTWPRTVCTIEGKDVNGRALKGEYVTSSGANIKMSDGFISNVKYFKCDWTPRKPEDYLLSTVLCLHIKEMIELETGREIDGKKNVLILNKDDFRKYIANAEVYAQVENIWLNQNMILSSDEMKLIVKKNYKYIPREYFGHELREAAE